MNKRYPKGANVEDLRRISQWRSGVGQRGYRSLIGRWYAEKNGIQRGQAEAGSFLEIYHRNHNRIWGELFPDEFTASSLRKR